jgi:hypothetical protein
MSLRRFGPFENAAPSTAQTIGIGYRIGARSADYRRSDYRLRGNGRRFYSFTDQTARLPYKRDRLDEVFPDP